MNDRKKVILEVRKVFRGNKRLTVALSMGVGKTKIALDHLDVICSYKGPTTKALVVAPTKKILKSWLEEIDKWDLKHLTEHITFSTYRSLSKQTDQYTVVYLDECHSIKSSHIKFLRRHKGYIIGLTGTPARNKADEKFKIMERFFPLKYEYLTEDAIDGEILNDYRIVIHLLSLSDEETQKVEIKDKKTGRIKNSWYSSESKLYSYWSNSRAPMAKIMRMKSMMTFNTKEVYAKKLLEESDKKCLLFANTKEQAETMCSHSFHSTNPKSDANMELFNKGEISKLSCVNQLSAGANMTNLEEGIIMHFNGNNRTGPQKLGRLLRLGAGKIATAHILCFKETIDVGWIMTALEEFDSSKITWYDTEEL